MDAVNDVDASQSDRLIEGSGTDEATWLASAALQNLVECDLRSWVRTYRRIWIIAPHPDDEILALGGTVVALARLSADLRFISVTDGEASHRDSPQWNRATLRDARRGELHRALQALGVETKPVRLALPDGDVSAHGNALLAALIRRVGADDLMLVTWRMDGHPDHEACAAATLRASRATGAAMVEYPVWMWHWAHAEEQCIPWSRARRLSLSAANLDRKSEAIAAFTSQLAVNEAGDAILPTHVLARFKRAFEVVFV